MKLESSVQNPTAYDMEDFAVFVAWKAPLLPMLQRQLFSPVYYCNIKLEMYLVMEQKFLGFKRRPKSFNT